MGEFPNIHYALKHYTFSYTNITAAEISIKGYTTGTELMLLSFDQIIYKSQPAF